jgi:hypothetical protein
MCPPPPPNPRLPSQCHCPSTYFRTHTVGLTSRRQHAWSPCVVTNQNATPPEAPSSAHTKRTSSSTCRVQSRRTGRRGARASTGSRCLSAPQWAPPSRLTSPPSRPRLHDYSPCPRHHSSLRRHAGLAVKVRLSDHAAPAGAWRSRCAAYELQRWQHRAASPRAGCCMPDSVVSAARRLSFNG